MGDLAETIRRSLADLIGTITFGGVVENILADFLFLVFGFVLTFLVLRWRRSRILFRFFGIKDSKRISIYVSNVNVTSRGSVGIDGRARSYYGTAVPYLEMQESNLMRSIYNLVIPGFAGGPDFLRYILLSDVDVRILASPGDFERVDKHDSMVSFGSAVYNAASGCIEMEIGSRTKFQISGVANHRFSNDTIRDLQAPATQSLASASGDAVGYQKVEPGPSGIQQEKDLKMTKTSASEAEKVGRGGIKVERLPLFVDTDYAFVEKVYDKANKRWAFYVAGQTEFGTAGAANYLRTRWKYLKKEFGANKAFLEILRIPANDYRNWSEVATLT